MIHRTSKMIANYLFSIGIIDKKDIEIYIYMDMKQYCQVL